MVGRFQVSQFTTPGGWAAAFNACDDRVVVFEVGEQLIAIVAEGSSPTYGGYYTPLGLELAVETFSTHLRDHRHACTVDCVRAVGRASSAALFALGRGLFLVSDGAWRVGDDVVARALAAPTVEESALRLGKAIGTAPRDDASAVIVALS